MSSCACVVRLWDALAFWYEKLIYCESTVQRVSGAALLVQRLCALAGRAFANFAIVLDIASGAVPLPGRTL